MEHLGTRAVSLGVTLARIEGHHSISAVGMLNYCGVGRATSTGSFLERAGLLRVQGS